MYSPYNLHYKCYQETIDSFAWYLRKKLSKQNFNQVHNHVDNQVNYQVHNQVDNQMHNQVQSQVGNQVHMQVNF